MSKAARMKLTAVLLEATAVILFLIAYTAHTWNGVMFLGLVAALAGVGVATFGADD